MLQKLRRRTAVPQGYISVLTHRNKHVWVCCWEGRDFDGNLGVWGELMAVQLLVLGCVAVLEPKRAELAYAAIV